MKMNRRQRAAALSTEATIKRKSPTVISITPY